MVFKYGARAVSGSGNEIVDSSPFGGGGERFDYFDPATATGVKLQPESPERRI